MRAIVVAVLAAVLTGCGVTAQDEPVPLVTSSVSTAATPTLTQRPDPSSSGSTTTTATTGTATTPPTVVPTDGG
ncbi:hypothetical protein [Actinosynnema sp. NPDC023587]|uniref:hypothetical protein n=1 Tax=Actinosynnema sp. NPDC023587 TaxID=3154695 RepID=UPI0033E81C9A